MAINLDRFNIEAQRTDKALGFSSMEEIRKAANSGFITVKALMQSTKPHPINLDCFSEDEIVAMWFVLFGAMKMQEEKGSGILLLVSSSIAGTCKAAASLGFHTLSYLLEEIPVEMFIKMTNE